MVTNSPATFTRCWCWCWRQWWRDRGDNVLVGVVVMGVLAMCHSTIEVDSEEIKCENVDVDC